MIKNPKLKQLPKEINEHDNLRKEMIEKCDGGIYLEVFIPNLSEEEFEKWQLGESIENAGYSFCVGEATNRARVVFHNALRRFLNDFEEDDPRVLLGEMIAQMKSKMVINEEDLDDNEP